MGGEVVDNLLDVAFHDCFNTIQGEPDPVIRDSSLGKVIGAYALAPVTAADLAFPFLGDLVLLLFDRRRPEGVT